MLEHQVDALFCVFLPQGQLELSHAHLELRNGALRFGYGVMISGAHVSLCDLDIVADAGWGLTVDGARTRT